MDRRIVMGKARPRPFDRSIRREAGLRLREARKRAGLTLERVAERLGVSRQTVSHWEQGRQWPSLEYARALADLYGVSVDSLMGRTTGEGGEGNLKGDLQLLLQESRLALRMAEEGELTDEEIRSIADFIRFVRGRRRR